MSNRFSFYSSFVNTNFTNNSFDTMENTIYHFLFNFSLFNSLSSCFKISIESSKGLYSLFINNYPYFNVNIISSDFLMINNLNKFCKNINLADLITILGSVDFVLGSIDLATTTNTTIYEWTNYSNSSLKCKFSLGYYYSSTNQLHKYLIKGVGEITNFKLIELSIDSKVKLSSKELIERFNNLIESSNSNNNNIIN